MTNNTNNQHAIAITGMGIVSGAGQGIPAFRDALFYGQNNFISQTYPKLSFPLIGTFIQDFSFNDSLHIYLELPEKRLKDLRKLIRTLPQHTQVALISAMETWRQAAIGQYPIDPERISIVVAGQNTNVKYAYDLMESFQQQPDYLSPAYALHFMDTDYIGVLSEVFGILGEGFTVGGASACGNVALLRAFQLIRDGWMDASLVVGALADLSPMEFQGFYNIGAMGGHRFKREPQKACRPFDKDHEGFIYGQAAGALFLESVASAKKRNVPILGYLLGGALVLDGTHSANPNVTGEMRAMQKALDRSGISVNEIDYINTHGTSAPLGDEIELKAIETLLGKRSHEVLINSTKSITGHCLWSAGIVEAIATIIQIQEQFVHPTLNLENPISKNSHFVINESEKCHIKLALSNSFGFGGINTSLVFASQP